jgi:hypothetical protein
MLTCTLSALLPAVFLAGTMCLLWGSDLEAGREVVILQIRVVEGEGLARAAGTRDARGLTVLIADETGRPVSRATVSFRLPDEGPGGMFRSGLRTEVLTTGPDGLASVRGMRWNRMPGPFEIRVIAGKDRARAGILVPQYLSATTARKTVAAVH